MDPNEPHRAPTWHFRCSFIAYSAYAPRIAKKRAKRLDSAFLSVYVAYALTRRRIRYKNRQFWERGSRRGGGRRYKHWVRRACWRARKSSWERSKIAIKKLEKHYIRVFRKGKKKQSSLASRTLAKPSWNSLLQVSYSVFLLIFIGFCVAFLSISELHWTASRCVEPRRGVVFSAFL